MHKIAQNIFKRMTSVVLEINTVNEELYGLGDIEKNEQPEIMMNEWQQREEMGAFMDKWKRFEQNELCCFYKYWCLNLKYAHWDAMAVLDMFTRYDIVYNKCKKIMKSKQKSEENKEATEEDADLNEKVRNIQILLNT